MFDRSPARPQPLARLPLPLHARPPHLRHLGKHVNIFHNVEFTFGYNLTIDDDCTIHNNVMLDDRGDIILHEGTSISDYANIYSHTHDINQQADVTNKPTELGPRARITYHATVLAGANVGEDAMLGAMALATKPVPPSVRLRRHPRQDQAPEDPARNHRLLSGVSSLRCQLRDEHQSDSDKLNDMNQEVVLIVFQIVVLVLAFSIHECAHAWTAWRLGDPTARMLGRITLNPLKHLDPFGSVLMPIIALVYHWPLVGWAKPTPVTSRNFKNYRRDDILVTLAGPASNLLSASVALVLLIVIKHALGGGKIAIATAVALVNNVPGIVAQGLPVLTPVALLLYYVILINLLLFVFNLLPVPPLDGSHILRHFLPYKAVQLYDRMGMILLIVLFLIGGSFIYGLFSPIFSVFNHLLFRL